MTQTRLASSPGGDQEPVNATSGASDAQRAAGSRPAVEENEQPPVSGQLFGIGAAAARAGVTERALRYYQQIGLLTPSQCTSGGMRRYSDEDLDRVTRIRQLQTLLGFNLDEVAVILRHEDRLSEIRRACLHEHTTDAQRLELARESLELQQDLRITVEAKRQAIDSFLADLTVRIARGSNWLARMTAEPDPSPQRLPASTGPARDSEIGWPQTRRHGPFG
jgi:MerR family transcriptional regulator, repressor of the yfmOP operon